MKKILILLPLILLASCGNNSTTNQIQQEEQTKETQNIEKNYKENSPENIQKEAEKAIENIEGKQNINSSTTNTPKNLQIVEEKKFKKITSLKSGLYFYWLDCHKLFKLPENIKKCERLWLKEASIACDNKSYFKWLSIDKIFNKKKFDMLSEQEIKQAKQKCLSIIKEKKEEEKKFELEQQKIEKYFKTLENFQVEECEKLFKLPENIKRCKISYAIKKDNCDVLEDSKLKNECKEASKYIKQYKLMEMYNKNYGNFTGFVWNTIKENLGLDIQIEE